MGDGEGKAITKDVPLRSRNSSGVGKSFVVILYQSWFGGVACERTSRPALGSRPASVRASESMTHQAARDIYLIQHGEV